MENTPTTFEDFKSMIEHYEAREKNLTTGDNGETAYLSHLDALIDLYSAQGALRGRKKEFLSYFINALKVRGNGARYHVPRTLALLLKLRDIRQGQGERELFREALRYLETLGMYPSRNYVIFDLILQYGRADDLWESFESKKSLSTVGKWIAKLLSKPEEDNRAALVAKWLPRRAKTAKEQYLLSVIRSVMKITPKEYRKLVVKRSEDVVEKLMCVKAWDSIDYSKIPSQAMLRYKNAFSRNDTDRYLRYLENLVKPVEERDEEFKDAKVNAATLYPYQVMNFQNAELASQDSSAAQLFKAQWEALPDFFKGNTTSILPMVDVSGSMMVSLPGSSTNVMSAAISLGAYIAQRQTGPFKNLYLTFSSHPTLFNIGPFFLSHNPITEIVNFIKSKDIGYSTDYNQAIKTVFEMAKKHNLPQEALPEIIMVFSDMNFDESEDYYSTAQDNVESLIKQYGYTPPKIVYWNLNHNGSFVCKVNQKGVCEVSGFSPSILEEILSNVNNITPESVFERGIAPYLEDGEKFYHGFTYSKEPLVTPVKRGKKEEMNTDEDLDDDAEYDEED